MSQLAASNGQKKYCSQREQALFSDVTDSCFAVENFGDYIRRKHTFMFFIPFYMSFNVKTLGL